MHFSKEHFSKTGNSIYNDDVRQFLAQRIQDWFVDSEKFSAMVNMTAYVEEMREWILSSKQCGVIGLEDFEVGCVSLGVTQALDQFHDEILQQKRRLRMFRGEYPYNRDVYPFDPALDYLDDFPVERGDAIILSCPFSATGTVHPRMGEILEQAFQLNVPVFIDSAWFGTCGGIQLDLSHPAITHVAFSLTKGLTCGNYRSGVRWTRHKKNIIRNDRLYLQQQWNHSIHLNLKIGRELMAAFNPDTQFHKYRQAQMIVCKKMGFDASPCVHIATTHHPDWQDFQRDGVISRINLRDAIKLQLKKTSE